MLMSIAWMKAKLFISKSNTNIILFWLFSLLSIYIFNSFVYLIVNKLFFVRFGITNIELLICFIFLQFLFILCRRKLAAVSLYMILYALFVGSNCYKLYYLNEALSIQDISLIPELFYIWPISNLVISFLLLGTTCFLFVKLSNIKENYLRLAAIIVFLVPLNIFLKKMDTQKIFEDQGLQAWSTRNSSEILGPLSYFWLHSLNYDFSDAAPSDEEFNNALNIILAPTKKITSTSDTPTKSKAEVRPNIYIVLVESFWDALPFLPQINFDPFSKEFRQKHNELGKKYAVVPHISGGTAQSEFEILCGLPNYNQAVLFKHSINSNIDCLPNVLKKLGYQTFAMHPGLFNMYNRNNTYPKIGFEHYIYSNQIYDLLVAKKLNQNSPAIRTADGFFLEAAGRFIEYNNKVHSKNLYYILTKGLHFPFKNTTEADDKALNSISNLQFRNYLALTNKSAQVLMNFYNLIKSTDPTGIIIITGDHSPHSLRSFLSESFIEDKKRNFILDQIKTPIITNNIDLPKENLMNLPYLTSLIYRKLGLPKYSSVSDMYQEPSHGLHLFDQIILSKDETLDCNNHHEANYKASPLTEANCHKFYEYKGAFKTILNDALFGNQNYKFKP